MTRQTRKARAKFARDRRHRATFQHPFTHERFVIEERTDSELGLAKIRYAEIHTAWRFGRLTHEQFDRELERLRKGKLREHSVPTVGEAWAAYVKTVSHPSTASKLKSVWKILEPLIASELVVALTDARLDALVAELERQGRSPKYITHSIWAFLSAAIRHAKAARVIERLPWEAFTPPAATTKNRPAAATSIAHVSALALAAREEDEADARRFAAATDNQRRAWRLSPLFDLERRVLVLFLCGLRNGEGAGLGWDRVDRARELLTVDVQAIDQWRTHFPDKTRPDFPTKNAKVEGPLVQRIHPDALAALDEQRAELERLGWYRDDGPVFPTVGGAWRLNANCIYPEDLKRIAIAAKLPNAEAWVTHSLRHSFATLELQGLGDPRATITRTGHASIRELEKYLHAERAVPSGIPRLSGGSGKPKHGERPP